jgi:hypothetical protein
MSTSDKATRDTAHATAKAIRDTARAALANLHDAQQALLDCPEVCTRARVNVILDLDRVMRSVSHALAKAEVSAEDTINHSYFG